MSISRKRQHLADRVLALTRGADERWVHVPEVRGACIRHSVELETPEWVRTDQRMPSGTVRARWPEPTYVQHVFVTLVSRESAPILRVCRAPWVECRDSVLTLTGALAVLDDPGSVL